MTFVSEENKVQHHIDRLNECALDLRDATTKEQFLRILDEELVWFLNDWALDEYAFFAKALMNSIERYMNNEPTPNKEEIIQHTFKLAELISLDQEVANAKTSNNIGSKAAEFVEGIKSSEILNEAKVEVQALFSDLGNKASEFVDTVKSLETMSAAKAGAQVFCAKTTDFMDEVKAPELMKSAKETGSILAKKARRVGNATATWILGKLSGEEFTDDTPDESDDNDTSK